MKKINAHQLVCMKQGSSEQIAIRNGWKKNLRNIILKNEDITDKDVIRYMRENNIQLEYI